MEIKNFFTYEQQVEKLNSKNLDVSDRERVIYLLKKYSYFTLINGYKTPFKNKDGSYKKNTSIEDIYSLYVFDDELRHIFMKNILIVELHIKSLLSYSFCKKFGESQSEYQNALNYNYTITDNQKPINELIQKLTSQIENADKFSYVDHHAKRYNNIPLWVLIKTLTFGNISKMYSFQQDSIKSSISKEFPLVKENELSVMLDVLSRYRNVCAHNERLYDFKYNKSRLKTTSIHKFFNLYTNNPSSSNLFDVVIFLKYLLNEYEYSKLIQDIESSLLELSKKTNQIQKSQILKLMGFPKNWNDIIDL
ncbi:MAG: Abi family protein [Candidatus Fimenecus sp.]